MATLLLIRKQKLLSALWMILLGLQYQLAQADSWHERRFRNMLPQELDMSCGAASIASLARFYAKQPIDESVVLSALASIVPPEQQHNVLENGFTLLHIKQAMALLNLELKAAKVQQEQLIDFKSPAMLQLKTTDGFHFVIWHGKLNGLHWLGDPSRGDMWLSDAELQKEWTGIAAWLFKDGKPLPQASQIQLQSAYHNR